MIHTPLEPADVGLLHHHGPELFPMVDLIVGGGLPVAAAVFFGRWRSIKARLAGGVPGPEDATVSGAGPIRSTTARLVPEAGQGQGTAAHRP